MKFVATEQNVDRVKEVAIEIDEHCHDMETKLTSIDASLVEIDGELEELSSDVEGVKSDVAGVKSDVADVKTDVADVKTSVYSVKNDVSSVKQDVARVKDDCESIGDTVDDIQNTVDNIRSTDFANVHTKLNTLATSTQIVNMSSTIAHNQTETVGKLDSIIGMLAGEPSIAISSVELVPTSITEDVPYFTASANSNSIGDATATSVRFQISQFPSAFSSFPLSNMLCVVPNMSGGYRSQYKIGRVYVDDANHYYTVFAGGTIGVNGFLIASRVGEIVDVEKPVYYQSPTYYKYTVSNGARGAGRAVREFHTTRSKGALHVMEWNANADNNTPPLLFEDNLYGRLFLETVETYNFKIWRIPT